MMRVPTTLPFSCVCDALASRIGCSNAFHSSTVIEGSGVVCETTGTCAPLHASSKQVCFVLLIAQRTKESGCSPLTIPSALRTTVSVGPCSARNAPCQIPAHGCVFHSGRRHNIHRSPTANTGAPASRIVKPSIEPPGTTQSNSRSPLPFRYCTSRR